MTDTLSENVHWHWHEHPIGFPVDPQDTDFKGPRTGPQTVLTIEYKGEDGAHWRQSIGKWKRKKDLFEWEIEEMKQVLTAWVLKKIEDQKHD